MILSLGWFKTSKFLKVNFIFHLFSEKSDKDSYRGVYEAVVWAFSANPPTAETSAQRFSNNPNGCVL